MWLHGKVFVAFGDDGQIGSLVDNRNILDTCKLQL